MGITMEILGVALLIAAFVVLFVAQDKKDDEDGTEGDTDGAEI